MRDWIIQYLLFRPTLGWNLMLHKLQPDRRWWDRVDDSLILGALPFRSSVPALKGEGVRAVINTCVEYPGPVEEYAQAGIEQLRLPTVDFTPPRLEDIERGVDFIRERAEKGETVYVHCKAGRGRSATIALCWLVAGRGLTPEQAQARLLELRPHVNKSLHRREVVREFCRNLNPPS